jgi:D-3-phosphoglycerate dehydrogenase
VKKIHEYHVVCLGRDSDEEILTDEVLRSAHRLFAIGVFGVFKNQVDIPTSQAMGIPIFTAPYQHQHSVAELIISYIVLLARQIGDRSKEIHTKQWNKVLRVYHRLQMIVMK